MRTSKLCLELWPNFSCQRNSWFPVVFLIQFASYQYQMYSTMACGWCNYIFTVWIGHSRWTTFELPTTQYFKRVFSLSIFLDDGLSFCFHPKSTNLEWWRLQLGGRDGSVVGRRGARGGILLLPLLLLLLHLLLTPLTWSPNVARLAPDQTLSLVVESSSSPAEAERKFKMSFFKAKKGGAASKEEMRHRREVETILEIQCHFWFGNLSCFVVWDLRQKLPSAWSESVISALFRGCSYIT